MGTQLPQKRENSSPPLFDPCTVAKARMDQDATWYGGRPQLRRHCVIWGSRYPQRGTAPSPIFGPCLLWPNGWMDQDATWYRLWRQTLAQPHCVGLGPAPLPPKWLSSPHPLFGPHLLWPNGRPSQLLLTTCTVVSTGLMNTPAAFTNVVSMQ